MLRKRDPYLEESLRQEFLLCDHSFWQRMEKEPSQEQNKNQPPVPQENPQMDSDQQENAGEKTSDATPLGKPIQRKTSGKNMQSVSKAIWKPMQKTRRQMRESLHGC